MTLTSGTQLGSYEIVSQIGEGGMGEVYRARDTKLGRDVAIKVLPAAFSEDADRLCRFEQEAQAAGALNHPSILVIYHIGTHSGAPYIVSELLEGQTLRERMNGTAVPQRKSLDLALQIARGLAAAHEKGIVHRDIKPDNIFITNDGRAKILDFGLAKLTAESSASESQTEVPTRKVNTDPGTVMGTVGYMSPEQLRGKHADARSDIFSFGAVFYEMLSGKRAFQRDSMPETMSAILKEDPPDLSTTNKTVSPALERVVHHCLEKNAEQRFHSASDLAFAIEALSGVATNSGQTTTLPISPIAEGSQQKWLHSSRFWIASTAVLGLALLALALFVILRPAPKNNSPIVRYDVLPLNKTGLSLIRLPAVAISPDGSTLAFLANGDGVNRLYVRKRDDTEVKVVPGTEGASDATFSPDGQSLAFIADFSLKKVPLNGPVVPLTKIGDSRGLSWMADDSLIYVPEATGGLFQISANGGEPRAITKVDEAKNERTHRWPQALPGGKAVLFTVGSLDKPDDYDNANIEAVVLETGERKLLLQGASVARYVPTGHLVFARDGVLYAVRFDLNRLTVSGKPVAVLTGVAGDKTTGAVHFSVSNDGTLAYVPGSTTSGLRGLTWVDKNGNQTPVDIPRGQFNDVRISPDGTRVAVLQGSSPSGDVWIYEFARATFTRLTFTTTNATPVWSADGKDIYYVSTDPAKDETTILRKPADGSHEAESIVTIPHQAYLKAILPDGETALLDTERQTNDSNIVTVALKPGAQPTPLVNTKFMEYAAAVSPDGRWLAYQSNESGRPEIYVRDIVGSGGRWPISTGGGEEPRWSPDGRELYYRINAQLMAVPIETHSSLITHHSSLRTPASASAPKSAIRIPNSEILAGPPKTLFNEVYDLRSNTGETYDVDPHGGRFLMTRPPKEDSSTAQVRIVLNWFGELQRLAP
ncbi:MAG: protein kinase [Blastocatellia bacterium]|nr:protein kinase [Blastocatellia bacterium]